jgi:ABC-2 type transport system permease protein
VIDDQGKSVDDKFETKMAIGIGLAVFIYFFIIMYGMQIMRGVMEEKTSRIVEVIVSSVKPFQLMMGKIIGIALVGLTQFFLWVVLSLTLTGVINATIMKNIIKDTQVQQAQKEQVFKTGANMNIKEMQKINTPMSLINEQKGLNDVDFTAIIICFGFYFLGGYLLYGALYAAMGAAVDTETDTQQFMLPVTIPIILSFVFAQYVAMNPTSSLSFWLSIIPFTSPITMMVRLPFGVPMWELALSMSLLVVGFIFTTWIAGKIYKTGILMYGKKTTWRELGKWLFYKS